MPEVLGILPAVLAEVPGSARAMGPQALSNSLWAAMQLQDAAPEVLQIVPAVAVELCGKAGGMMPQVLCNTLSVAVQLQDVAPEVLQIVPALAERIAEKAPQLIPPGVSSSLWAAAKLRDAVPDVVRMVPPLVAELPGKATMRPLALSNCLFALMCLEEAAPEVLRAVPHLVKQVPKRIGHMNVQDLAKTLEALVVLESCVPIPELPKIMRAAAARLKQILSEVKGKDFSLTVPTIIWAFAKTETYDAELLAAVAERFASNRSVNLLPRWNLCALAWAYRKLEVDPFQDLLSRLEAAMSRKALREEEVLAEK